MITEDDSIRAYDVVFGLNSTVPEVVGVLAVRRDAPRPAIVVKKCLGLAVCIIVALFEHFLPVRIIFRPGPNEACRRLYPELFNTPNQFRTVNTFWLVRPPNMQHPRGIEPVKIVPSKAHAHTLFRFGMVRREAGHKVLFRLSCFNLLD